MTRTLKRIVNELKTDSIKREIAAMKSPLAWGIVIISYFLAFEVVSIIITITHFYSFLFLEIGIFVFGTSILFRFGDDIENFLKKFKKPKKKEKVNIERLFK